MAGVELHLRPEDHAAQVQAMLRRTAALAFAVLVMATGAVAGKYRPPRAADGHPDLGGLWTSISLTELERPSWAPALTLTGAQALAFEARRKKEFASAEDGVGGRASEIGFWPETGARLARIDGKARSSWIVDPADGRLPYTAEGLAAVRGMPAIVNNASNPETRNASERCLLSGFAGSGPPMLNGPYASLYQFVQTRDAVAIHLESVHDVRVVRLDAKAHLPANVRPWLGDSIGRWEGETLVVETTNFNPGDAYKMPIGVYISPQAKVTERFTRVSPTQLRYDFTVDDPSTFSKAWRAEMVFEATKGPIYEYACHEGNYALPGILAGARHEEAQSKVTAGATR
jgi:hypothetical protein